jgi:hypothetical protein
LLPRIAKMRNLHVFYANRWSRCFLEEYTYTGIAGRLGIGGSCCRAISGELLGLSCGAFCLLYVISSNVGDSVHIRC